MSVTPSIKRDGLIGLCFVQMNELMKLRLYWKRRKRNGRKWSTPGAGENLRVTDAAADDFLKGTQKKMNRDSVSNI